jgi:hypothetical protein
MLAAFWWGSLTTIGFLVVPMLFAKLGNPSVAGNFAGQLFDGAELGSHGLRLLLLIHQPARRLDGRADDGASSVRPVALLLALLQQYAVAPRIVARDNLPLWHAVGQRHVLVQWLCAACCSGAWAPQAG